MCKVPAGRHLADIPGMTRREFHHSIVHNRLQGKADWLAGMMGVEVKGTTAVLVEVACTQVWWGTASEETLGDCLEEGEESMAVEMVAELD